MSKLCGGSRKSSNAKPPPTCSGCERISTAWGVVLAGAQLGTGGHGDVAFRANLHYTQA